MRMNESRYKKLHQGNNKLGHMVTQFIGHSKGVWILFFFFCFFDFFYYTKISILGFPGGAVVENLPSNAGNTGSSPGLGRSHMLRSI